MAGLAQQTRFGVVIPAGSVLPSTCAPQDWFYLTEVPIGLYRCVAIWIVNILAGSVCLVESPDRRPAVAALAADRGGPVPPLVRVASPFAAVASSCPEGTCSWTWDTEEFCYDSGTVINTPSCDLTCECGSWRVDCG